jgi:hypothetical protein
MSADRRLFLAAAVVTLTVLTGCAQRQPPLYLWENFPRQQYDTLLQQGGGSQEQISVLEAQAEKARATDAALPPGFRAHLGMLYLGAGNPGRANELWKAEKVAFPESSPYMDRLLTRLNAQAVAPAAPKEKPL